MSEALHGRRGQHGQHPREQTPPCRAHSGLVCPDLEDAAIPALRVVLSAGGTPGLSNSLRAAPVGTGSGSVTHKMGGGCSQSIGRHGSLTSQPAREPRT